MAKRARLDLARQRVAPASADEPGPSVGRAQAARFSRRPSSTSGRPPSVLQPPGPAAGGGRRRSSAAMEALQRHRLRGRAEAFQDLLRAFPRRAGAARPRPGLSRSSASGSCSGSPPNPHDHRGAADRRHRRAQQRRRRRRRRRWPERPRGAPDHDLALYLLAAVEARRGADDAALDLLTQRHRRQPGGRRAGPARPGLRARCTTPSEFRQLTRDARRRAVGPRRKRSRPTRRRSESIIIRARCRHRTRTC